MINYATIKQTDFDKKCGQDLQQLMLGSFIDFDEDMNEIKGVYPDRSYRELVLFMNIKTIDYTKSKDTILFQIIPFFERKTSLDLDILLDPYITIYNEIEFKKIIWDGNI